MLVRSLRKITLVVVDIILINISMILSLFFRFEGNIPQTYLHILFKTFVIMTAFKIIIYYLFGLYRSLWRYASIDELIQVCIATTVGAISSVLYCMVLHMMLPRLVYVMSWILTTMLLGGYRMSYRILHKVKTLQLKDPPGIKRVMVIGAGNAGSMVIKEMKNHEGLQYKPVVVIDDDGWKHRKNIHGVPVAGGRDRIIREADKNRIDEIIIAMPSAKKRDISEILNLCTQTRCRLKTLPGVYDLINNKVSVRQIRDVHIEDLLGRDEVKLNTEEIAGYIKNEVVLVTGGGGSIGSELCRQIAAFRPRKLIIMDIYENNAYDLQNELLCKYPSSLNLEVVIGSVRDKARLNEIFKTYRPGIVFHAAAHKHVPLMENNPAEAIKNNVFGTLNTAQCADKYGVRKFVLISTDKAVNPTNIMGATKRVAEMIIQSLDKVSKTEFVAVRFGNVLGSNGSVIPLFKRQIAIGGPVTVTHPEITRFFMTIPEASRLVIQAGAIAKGGEIFVLDMGEPVRITDLARDLIRLSGFEPDVDMKIKYTGLRPGEKLYEELLLAEEGVRQTRHKGIFVARPLDMSYNEVLMCIRALENRLGDINELRKCLANIVPTYKPATNGLIAKGDLKGVLSSKESPLAPTYDLVAAKL